jgi:hypothetical protein
MVGGLGADPERVADLFPGQTVLITGKGHLACCEDFERLLCLHGQDGEVERTWSPSGPLRTRVDVLIGRETKVLAQLPEEPMGRLQESRLDRTRTGRTPHAAWHASILRHLDQIQADPMSTLRSGTGW